jgi:hypothetical protein
VRKQVRDDSSLLLWVVYSRTHCDRCGISEDKRSVSTQLGFVLLLELDGTVFHLMCFCIYMFSPTSFSTRGRLELGSKTCFAKNS